MMLETIVIGYDNSGKEIRVVVSEGYGIDTSFELVF